MAEERTEEVEHQTPEKTYCANNCGFYGSATTNNLCSKCYKDHIMKQQHHPSSSKSFDFIPITQGLPSTSPPVQFESIQKQVDKVDESHGLRSGKVLSTEEDVKQQINRCIACQRKVGLTAFRCRCGGMFCPVHRYSEKHECSFDYRGVGRDAIARENPVIKARKLEKI